jgi:monoterpene epsilon-lactone hydrolase
MMPSLGSLVFRAFSSTVRSRFRNGPLFPGWSFSFEGTTRLLKLRAVAVGKLPLDEQRKIQEIAGDQEAKRMKSKVDRQDARVGGIDGEWFVPKGKTPQRVVLYIHGGGFVTGSSRTHAEMLMRLAIAADARIYAPNYRLAPEHRYPAQIDDCRAVYQALLADGIRPESLIIAGDSAGGTLSITLPLVLRDEKIPLPAGIAALSPWVDLANRTGSLLAHEPYDWATPADFDGWLDHYLGKQDPKAPLASPIFADLHGLPPLRIDIGTAEMLLDQVRAFGQRAKEAGLSVDYHEIPGMVHNGYLLAGYFPECQAAIDDLGAWMKRTVEV